MREAEMIMKVRLAGAHAITQGDLIYGREESAFLTARVTHVGRNGLRVRVILPARGADHLLGRVVKITQRSVYAHAVVTASPAGSVCAWCDLPNGVVRAIETLCSGRVWSDDYCPAHAAHYGIVPA